VKAVFIGGILDGKCLEVPDPAPSKIYAADLTRCKWFIPQFDTFIPSYLWQVEYERQTRVTQGSAVYIIK